MRRIPSIWAGLGLVAAAMSLRGGALVWDRTTLALTAEPGQAVVTADFPVRNGSTHPIRITSLQADCDCTTAEAQPEVLPAGGHGLVHVVLKAGEIMGRRSESIEVGTDEKGGALDELTLEVLFPAGVSVTPRVLHWEVGGPADAQTAICAADPTVSAVTGVEPNADFEVTLETLAAGRTYAWRVRPKSTAEPHTATLLLDLKSAAGRSYHFPLHAWVIAASAPAPVN